MGSESLVCFLRIHCGVAAVGDVEAGSCEHIIGIKTKSVYIQGVLARFGAVVNQIEVGSGCEECQVEEE